MLVKYVLVVLCGSRCRNPPSPRLCPAAGAGFINWSCDQLTDFDTPIARLVDCLSILADHPTQPVLPPLCGFFPARITPGVRGFSPQPGADRLRNEGVRHGDEDEGRL